MSQTRKRSAAESIANTSIGLVYALVINYVLLKYVTWSSIESQAFYMTIWFTLGSLIRQYFMRRFFNWLDQRKA